MNCAVPFHVGKNSCHQAISAHASLLRRMWWCSFLVFVLSVIRCLMKSLPISESSFRFVILLWDCHLVSSAIGFHLACQVVCISAVILSPTPDPEKERLPLDHLLCLWQLGSLEVCTLSGNIAGAHRSCANLVHQL